MRSVKKLLVGGVFALASVASSTARADDTVPTRSYGSQDARGGEPAPPREPAAAARKILYAEGSAGIGAPLGWLGVSAVVLPISALAIHGGIGVGSQSFQFSAGARGRTPIGPKSNLSFGGSWSTGSIAVIGSSAIPRFSGEGNKPETWFWSRAHIVNVDASLEFVTPKLVVRPFVGIGYVVNAADAFLVNRRNKSDPAGTPPVSACVIPYLGFALAWGLL